MKNKPNNSQSNLISEVLAMLFYLLSLCQKLYTPVDTCLNQVFGIVVAIADYHRFHGGRGFLKSVHSVCNTTTDDTDSKSVIQKIARFHSKAMTVIKRNYPFALEKEIDKQVYALYNLTKKKL